MRPRRWLPLPTCRPPLRRFIASLTIVAMVATALPVTVLAQASAGATTATLPSVANSNSADETALCDNLFLAPEKKAKEQSKFLHWRSNVQAQAQEHLRTGPAKEAMDQALRRQNNEPADLIGSVQRQVAYLDRMGEAADLICPTVKAFEQDVKKIGDEVTAADAKKTAETCAFKDLEEISARSKTRLAAILEGIESGTEKMRSMYVDYAKFNHEAVSKQVLVAKTMPIEMHDATYSRASKLNSEVAQIWGPDGEYRKATDGGFKKEAPRAILGRVLLQLENQTRRVEVLNTNLEAYKERVKLMVDTTCKSARESTPNAGQRGATPNAGAADAKGASGAGTAPGSGTVSVGGATICKPGTSAIVRDGELSSTACSATTTAPTTGNPAPTGAGLPAPTGRTTAGTPLPGADEKKGNADDKGDRTGTGNSTTPPTRTTEVEEESWVSKNKGMLIVGGVGVAAVAGALLWKKSEDDKAKKDARYMEIEANMLVANQRQSASENSSGGDGSGDSTAGGSIAPNQTPVGSTLMIEGTPAGSVAVNTTLPPITVKIVNPEGIMTTDSSTDITVSCASSTPSPCTLTGTLTVNSDVGKSTFSNLKFTGAHTNVKLQFSAGGFNPVVSGNFDINGRQ